MIKLWCSLFADIADTVYNNTIKYNFWDTNKFINNTQDVIEEFENKNIKDIEDVLEQYGLNTKDIKCTMPQFQFKEYLTLERVFRREVLSVTLLLRNAEITKNIKVSTDSLDSSLLDLLNVASMVGMMVTDDPYTVFELKYDRNCDGNITRIVGNQCVISLYIRKRDDLSVSYDIIDKMTREIITKICENENSAQTIKVSVYHDSKELYEQTTNRKLHQLVSKYNDYYEDKGIDSEIVTRVKCNLPGTFVNFYTNIILVGNDKINLGEELKLTLGNSVYTLSELIAFLNLSGKYMYNKHTGKKYYAISPKVMGMHCDTSGEFVYSPETNIAIFKIIIKSNKRV